MNKKRVRFHESVKKEDGNSIKKSKMGQPSNIFNFSGMNNALNVIDKFAKLDEILDGLKNNTIHLPSLPKQVLLNLKEYCTIDIDIRNYIIQELISRDN
jgi:hypothetical protein